MTNEYIRVATKRHNAAENKRTHKAGPKSNISNIPPLPVLVTPPFARIPPPGGGINQAPSCDFATNDTKRSGSDSAVCCADLFFYYF